MVGVVVIASSPFSAARDSGVRPLESFESTFAFPVSSSSFTVVSSPFSAARDSGV